MTDGDRPLDMQMGERCDICGRLYRMHYQVSDDVWSKVIPSGNKTGYLCLSCADFRARQKGIELCFKAEVRSSRTMEEIRDSWDRYRCACSREQK